jgi:hypothetical protein
MFSRLAAEIETGNLLVSPTGDYWERGTVGRHFALGGSPIHHRSAVAGSLNW